MTPNLITTSIAILSGPAPMHLIDGTTWPDLVILTFLFGALCIFFRRDR